MTDDRLKASWESAAEELVRHVRLLLDHGDAIEKALRKSLGKEEARSRLRQLETLVESLEIELWQAGSSPDRSIVASITTGLRRTLSVVGLTVIGLIATDIYREIVVAEAQATRVFECVIDDRADEEPASSTPGAVDTETDNTANDVDSDVTDADDTEGSEQPLPAVPDFTIVLRGYERTQVDTYIDTLRRALARGDALSGVSAMPDFTIVLRGYERTQVDAYLQRLILRSTASEAMGT
ncbi:MAG: hypothetical protein ACRD2C_07405 [Acidimicrobiales bacterium]